MNRTAEIRLAILRDLAHVPAVKMTYAAGCSCKWCRLLPARKLKPN